MGLLLALGFITIAHEAWAPPPSAISIAVTGSWSETINSNDLIAGAGTDLISDYQSAVDAVSVSISGTTGPTDTWRVDVKKQAGNWDNDFILYVRRTSDGTGGSVSGGVTYQEVRSNKQTFFNGSDDVSGIDVQLKLSGVSILLIPADIYSTTVLYTLVDTK